MTYREHGFVLRRGLLPDETLRLVTNSLERVHCAWLAEQGDEGRRLDLVNSYGLTASRYFPPPFRVERAALFDGLADPTIHDLVTETFADDLYFHGTQMFFNPLAGRRKPYWHRDVQYMGLDEDRQEVLFGELCNLHVRIPLRAERSFLLVPGSHARWDTASERDVRLERDGHASSEDLPTARAFDLLPGDVLLFSAHMLHRGTYEGNGERLSLDLMLGRPHAAVRAGPDRDQLPDSDELAGVRYPGWYQRAHQLLLHTPE